MKSDDLTQDIRKLTGEAEAGDPMAQCLLGDHYYRGKLVPKNLVEAEKWWRKAAEKDIVAAQYYLGFYCYENIGVDEALKWLTKAANNGGYDAQMFLGVIHFWGGPVPRDRVTSLKWLMLGSECKRNSKWQPKALCWIAKALTRRAKVEQARRLAEEWKRRFAKEWKPQNCQQAYTHLHQRYSDILSGKVAASDPEKNVYNDTVDSFHRHCVNCPQLPKFTGIPSSDFE
jgi:TPR repeat protein